MLQQIALRGMILEGTIPYRIWINGRYWSTCYGTDEQDAKEQAIDQWLELFPDSTIYATSVHEAHSQSD